MKEQVSFHLQISMDFRHSSNLLWEISFAGVGDTELQDNGCSLLLPFCMAARSLGMPKGFGCLTLQSLFNHLEILLSYSRAWHIPSFPPWYPAGILPLQQHIFCRSRAIPPLQPVWQKLFVSLCGSYCYIRGYVQVLK